jgi:hypothetical protein
MMDFIVQYSELIIAIVVAILYELIAASNLESNSIFQLVKNICEELLNKLEKK